MGLVYGVGVNDVDYVVQIKKSILTDSGEKGQKLIWICPFYRKWKHMLERGYSDRFKLKHPTYKDCSVCDEWHLFSNFKRWMEQQDWEGKQLDKDILVQDNKLYSPDTCVFVSQQTNSFIGGGSKGKYKAGVCWFEPASKFMAQCSNPFIKGQHHVGYFDTEQEAHNAWLKQKLQYAYELAELQTDERVAKALIERYTNYSDETV